MDAKSLAKSKRAHSLHLNKKHNPHHASKGSTAASSTSSGDKKPSVKQVKEKPKSKLPSNWDRYEEEYSDSETATQEGASNASDVVVPKSKGADYAYMLLEAKAQFQFSSENVSFCDDDILDDFYQGLGALLSAKGQSKLSWLSEDNFAMEDKAPPPTKASFFSLDLHALSEQLERASLSERLFVEPDLLPLELRTESSQTEEKNDSNSLTSTNVLESNKSRNQHSEFPHLGITTSGSKESSNPSSIFKDEARQSDTLMFASELNMSANKPSTFKAAAAEAELDMLLYSNSEIKFFESTNVIDQSIRQNVTQAGTPTSLSEGTSSKSEVSIQPKPTISNISLDDTLDDLLKETSIVINKNEHSPPNEVNSTVGFASSTSQPVKPKIIDDFDSWFDTL